MGVTIRNNNGIYELPGKLPNNSSLSILGKKKFRKFSKLHEISSLCQVFLPKRKCCLKYFAHDCLMIVGDCEKELKSRFVDNHFFEPFMNV